MATAGALLAAVGTAWLLDGMALAAAPALTLRAAVVGASPADGLTIEVFRWSTDAERAPIIDALTPAAPAPVAAPAAAEAAQGRGGRAGRGGGRGGRGGAAPASPLARLSSAVRGAPTVGFIWGDRVTGYSIKYAWRTAPDAGSPERIVLIVDRRLGAHATEWPVGPTPNADAEFTLVELRLDARGAGEGKASLTTGVAVDPAAKTLALDGYASAPVMLKVTR